MELIHDLLPIASGYFGAASVLYELGGLTVIYGPAGGAWHVNIGDEYRWYRGKTRLVGAGLLEMDVILGKDSEFIDRIVKVARDLKPRFLTLLGTPISAIIGTDLKGLSNAMQSELDIPVFCIETKGTETYVNGASRAFLELARHFLKPRERIPRSVNILGAIHLDIGHRKHLKPLLSILRNLNYRVISIWGMESNINDIVNSTKASLNVVVTSSGLPLANYMRDTFGIPYVVGFPIGKEVEKWPEKFDYSRKKKTGKQKALIIHEPIIGLSIGRFMEHELGMNTLILSPTEFNGLGKNQNVIKAIYSERELLSITETFDYVIADPCYQPLLRYKKFIPMPHPAMSGRLYMDFDYDYIGMEGAEYIKGKTA